MHTAHRFLLSAVVVSALASPLNAQTPPPAKTATPEEGRGTEAAIEAQLRIAERPETAARIATFKRNLYEALLKKGFSGDQAIQLTIATPLPSMQTR